MKRDELISSLHLIEDDLEVFVYDDCGGYSEVTSLQVTDYKEEIVCTCNHEVTRHSISIEARVDRLFGGAINAGRCEKFQPRERKIVILT